MTEIAINMTAGAEALDMQTRYLDIGLVLTHHLRLLTAEQIGRNWFAHTVAPTKIALQFLRREERRGLLKLEHAMIHPPLNLQEPILDWRPESSTEPNWQTLAWKVQSRWNQHPVRAVVVSATSKARNLTGGPIGGRPTRPLEISHDATLAEIFLQLRRTHSLAATTWIPEDALTDFGHGKKKPDALITIAEQEVLLELAGKAYSPKRLADIHAAHRHRPYRMY